MNMPGLIKLTDYQVQRIETATQQQRVPAVVSASVVTVPQQSSQVLVDIEEFW